MFNIIIPMIVFIVAISLTILGGADIVSSFVMAGITTLFSIPLTMIITTSNNMPGISYSK